MILFEKQMKKGLLLAFASCNLYYYYKSNLQSTHKIQLHLIRHGQTHYNKFGIYQGQLDIDLTDLGISQASAIGSRLKNEKYEKIFCSDLVRCKNTFENIRAANTHKYSK